MAEEDGDDEEGVWFSRRLRGSASPTPYLQTGHKEKRHDNWITLFTTDSPSREHSVLPVALTYHWSLWSECLDQPRCRPAPFRRCVRRCCRSPSRQHHFFILGCSWFQQVDSTGVSLNAESLAIGMFTYQTSSIFVSRDLASNLIMAFLIRTVHM